MVFCSENTPGSAGILACMLSSTAARMAALPGTFSSSCVSFAHDNCSKIRIVHNFPISFYQWEPAKDH
jgi:hypothetical protein